jgi:hypothetical protein
MALHDQTLPALDTRLRTAPALFAATLFCSALLLFAVQPMFAKMVLPSLGGAPSVWSVAMVFFQGALLVGYGYAHLIARRLTVGQGALVHLGVLAAAALTLPIGLAHGFGTPPSSSIGLWLVTLFAASIGLPFVGAAEGLVTFVKADDKATQFVTDFHAAALVAVLVRDPADLGALPQADGWRRENAGDVAAWTDDYSDIIGAILRKKLAR